MTEVVRTTITWPIGNLQADVVALSSDPTKAGLVVTNADWSSVWSYNDSKYKTANIDDTDATYTYIWKSAADNSWYILRITNADNTFRYVRWTSDYETNWTNKATLTYNLRL